MDATLAAIDVLSALGDVTGDVEAVVTAALPFAVGIFGAGLAFAVGKKWFSKAK